LAQEIGMRGRPSAGHEAYPEGNERDLQGRIRSECAIRTQTAQHLVSIESETAGGECRIDLEQAQLHEPTAATQANRAFDPHLDSTAEAAHPGRFQGVGDGHHDPA
jgi:hypothetical protein